MQIVNCFVCGKDFVLAPCNIYKVTVEGKVKHLCSYGCMRKAEKMKGVKKKSKKRL